VEKTKFAMAFHCYQPVLNSEQEFERAYKTAYSPLLGLFEEFSDIKATFHFPGNILEWFNYRHPEYVLRIKKLLFRGQIELIGGGFFEPVMTLIPEQDRRDQISMNNRIIEDLFGVKPRGIWLAERVWEPQLADTLIASNMEYTIVDDEHLLGAGIDAAEISFPYKIKSKNGEVTLFPVLKQLRYAIPFHDPERVLKYMKFKSEKSPEGCSIFFADDGEKFGSWPRTHRIVYGKGWLRRFFTLLRENNDWLEPSTYSEVLDTAKSRPISNVPSSSYSEMMEWSGGDFNNFLKKYPEVKRMHERMTGISEEIKNISSKMPECGQNSELTRAKKELFKAQSGCAYWHGTFGGVYLPHLRAGVYRHLIKTQSIVDKISGEEDKKVSVLEYNADEKKNRIVIRNKFIDVFVNSDGGGKIGELDHKLLNANLTNIITRTREQYHRKLDKKYSRKIKKARYDVLHGKKVDIHDVLGVAERGLKKILFYDKTERTSFNTHIFTDRVEYKDLYKGRTGHQAFLNGTYKTDILTKEKSVTAEFSKKEVLDDAFRKKMGIEVTKRITIGSGPEIRFLHNVAVSAEEKTNVRYAVEFNFLIWDKQWMKRVRRVKKDRFSLMDRYLGIGIDFSFDKKYDILTYPIFTVNETESGLRRTFQGISLLVFSVPGTKKLEHPDSMEIVVKLR